MTAPGKVNGYNSGMSDTPYTADQVGARVQRLRESLGQKQADFARVIGVKPQELFAWESGERRPSIAKAQPMVEQFGVTLDWLFLGDASNLPHRVAQMLLKPTPEREPEGRD